MIVKKKFLNGDLSKTHPNTNAILYYAVFLRYLDLSCRECGRW